MSNVHCITIIRELNGEGQSVARTLFLVCLALSTVNIVAIVSIV